MNDKPTNTKALRRVTALSILVIALVGLPIVVYAAGQAIRTDTRAAVESTVDGDVNRDGSVNLDDVAEIRKEIENGEYNKSADLNSDGEVNSADISTFYEILSLKQ